MAYELELIQHTIDEKTHHHHLIVQLVELDVNGNEIGRGEVYQRSFNLPNAEDGFDFDGEFTALKALLAERYGRVKKHTDTLHKAFKKHFRNKKDKN